MKTPAPRLEPRAEIRSMVRAIENADKSAPTEAEVLIYDFIGWMGVEAKDVVRDLKALGPDIQTIHLRVNSPGGDVFGGLAIYNALRDHKADVITHIDGLAASIASIIALAGDQVLIADNAFFMIHDPWSFAMGNAAEIRKLADTLDKIGGSLTDTYVKASGMPKAKVEAMMHAETWMDAEEAIANGFCDSVEGADGDEADEAIAARFDLSIFAKTPAELLAVGHPTPETHRATSAPTKRTIERSLRDAGVSRTHAKTIAADAAKALADKALAQRDAGAEELTTALRAIVARTTG